MSASLESVVSASFESVVSASRLVLGVGVAAAAHVAVLVGPALGGAARCSSVVMSSSVRDTIEPPGGRLAETGRSREPVHVHAAADDRAALARCVGDVDRFAAEVWGRSALLCRSAGGRGSTTCSAWRRSTHW